MGVCVCVGGKIDKCSDEWIGGKNARMMKEQRWMDYLRD